MDFSKVFSMYFTQDYFQEIPPHDFLLKFLKYFLGFRQEFLLVFFQESGNLSRNSCWCSHTNSSRNSSEDFLMNPFRYFRKTKSGRSSCGAIKWGPPGNFSLDSFKKFCRNACRNFPRNFYRNFSGGVSRFFFVGISQTISPRLTPCFYLEILLEILCSAFAFEIPSVIPLQILPRIHPRVPSGIPLGISLKYLWVLPVISPQIIWRIFPVF